MKTIKDILGKEERIHDIPMRPPNVGVVPFFRCCYCDRNSDVIYKGTSLCLDCYKENMRTGAL